MVRLETFDRILKDKAYLETFGGHGLFENRPIVISDRTYEPYGFVRLILHEVAADELDEMVIDEIVYAGIVNMIGAELGQFGEETIREGLAIDLLKNIGHGGIVFAEERLFEVVAELILKQVSDESFAEHCGRSFVA